MRTSTKGTPQKENCMKKAKRNSLRLVGIIALVAVIGFTVVACNKGGGGSGGGGGKLSGTYANEDLKGWTMTFSGSKVTQEMMGEKAEGTFKIDGDKITMTIQGETVESKFKLEGNKFIMTADGATLIFIKQ
jgi:hypothetical protein